MNRECINRDGGEESIDIEKEREKEKYKYINRAREKKDRKKYKEIYRNTEREGIVWMFQKN